MCWKESRAKQSVKGEARKQQHNCNMVLPKEEKMKGTHEKFSIIKRPFEMQQE